MKKLVMIMLYALAGSYAWAQSDIFDSGDNQAHFGIHMSWDLNSPVTNRNDIVSTYHNGSGLSAGAYYNIPVYKNMFVEPGLNIFYNTMVISQDVAEDISLDYPLTREGSLRNSGIRIPVTIGYKFDFTNDISMAVFTGPQLNIGVTLKEYEKNSHKTRSLYDEGWHRLDAQWIFGVRFYYSDNWTAQISGGIGMTNLAGGDNWHGDTFRRNTFSIGVGYVF